MSSDGTFSAYTPASGYEGTDSFTYTASDDYGHSATATVTLTITAEVQAVDDSAEGESGSAINVDVLGNDTDRLDHPLHVDSWEAPSHGEVVVESNGSLTYTPQEDFIGTDSFTYTASDDYGHSATATVWLTVGDGVAAVDDAYGCDQGGSIHGNVLSNDIESFGHSLVSSSFSGRTAHGYITLSSDGWFTYTPDTTFLGKDTFTYYAAAGCGHACQATVTLCVGTDQVTAVDDSFKCEQGSSVSDNVLANDTDFFEHALHTNEDTWATDHGSVTLSSDGTFTYTPDSGYEGTDSFTYTAFDDYGHSATATVTLTITGTNQAPVLSGANSFTTIAEDDATNAGNLVSGLIAGQVNDANLEDAQGIAVIGADSEHGTWEYSRDGGENWASFGTTLSESAARLLAADDFTRVRFVPAENWNGTVSDGLTFRAWDQTTGSAGDEFNITETGNTTAFSSYSASASITVTAVNDAPILDSEATYTLAGIMEGATNSEGTVVSNLLGDRVFDVDGDTCGIAIISVDNSAGHWEYSTGSGWLDVDTVGDAQSLLLSAGDRIRLVPADHWNGDLASAITFRAWDHTIGTAGTKASTTINGDTTPFSSEPVSASISVTAVNDAPSFTKGGNVTVYQGAGEQTVTGWATSMSAGPDNEDDQSLGFVVTTDNASLFASLPTIDATTGDLTFTPATDAYGTATVTVYLKDDGGTTNGGVDTASQTFTITVNSREIQIDPINGTPEEGTVITATGSVGVASGDVSYGWVVYKNGSSSPYAVSEGGGSACFTFTPDDNGTYRIVFSAGDELGTCSTSQTITVINVAPNPSILVTETTTAGFAVLATASPGDPGTADTWTYSWVVYQGTSTTAFATGTGSSSFSFTPTSSGDYTIAVTVTDDEGGVGTATQTVSTSSVCYWTGTADDNLWTTAANWSTNSVPGATSNVVIDVSGTPTISVSGAASITIASLVCAESLEVDGTLTVSDGATLSSSTVEVSGTLTVGGSLVNSSDVVVEDTGTLTIGLTLTNTGDVIVKGDGIINFEEDGVFDPHDREVLGAEAAISGTEVFLSWTSIVGDLDCTYALEMSSDGTTYTQIAQLTADDTSYLVCNLEQSTTYYFRAVATSSNNGRLIYEGGPVTTIATTADDSGWYQIVSLIDTTTDEAIDLLTIDLIDTSSVYAGSELGAFLKVLSNNHLVIDGSVPSNGVIQSGAIQATTVNDDGTFIGLTLLDEANFDSSRYPHGAYSDPAEGNLLAGDANSPLKKCMYKN